MADFSTVRVNEKGEKPIPFDSSTSAVTLIVKGNSWGITGFKAFSASAPIKVNTVSV